VDQWRWIAEKASRQCVCLTQAKAQWRVGTTVVQSSEKVHHTAWDVTADHQTNAPSMLCTNAWRFSKMCSCEMVVEQWRPKATEVDCHGICGTQSRSQWRRGMALEVHQDRRDPTHIGKARFDTMDLLVSAHGKANWSLPLTHRAIPHSYWFLGLPLLDSTCLHDTTTPSDLA